MHVAIKEFNILKNVIERCCNYIKYFNGLSNVKFLAPVVQWLRSPPPTRRTRIRFPAGVLIILFPFFQLRPPFLFFSWPVHPFISKISRSSNVSQTTVCSIVFESPNPNSLSSTQRLDDFTLSRGVAVYRPRHPHSTKGHCHRGRRALTSLN